MKSLALGIVTAAALTLATGCCTHAKTVAWEYRVIQGATHQPDLEQKLNEAGKEGFAILSSTVMPPSQAGNYPTTMVILKRPKR